MEANIQNIKLDLIQWLISLDDNTLIQKVIDIQKSHGIESKTNTSEMEKISINKGISDANNGKLNSHTEARKIYAKWL